MTAQPIVPSNSHADGGNPRDLEPSRPRWRASLGGVLVFAAGLMIGFAPVRTWMFLQDDPEYVVIDAILVEMPAAKSDAMCADLERVGTETDGAFDAEAAVLATPGVKIVAAPSILALVGRTAEFAAGGERFVSVPPDLSGSRFFGIAATFRPVLRKSGDVELDFSLRHSRFIDDPVSGKPVERKETTIDSSIVAPPGVWFPFELGRPTVEHVDHDRVQWLLLRVQAK